MNSGWGSGGSHLDILSVPVEVVNILHTVGILARNHHRVHHALAESCTELASIWVVMLNPFMVNEGKEGFNRVLIMPGGQQICQAVVIVKYLPDNEECLNGDLPTSDSIWMSLVISVDLFNPF